MFVSRKPFFYQHFYLLSRFLNSSCIFFSASSFDSLEYGLIFDTSIVSSIEVAAFPFNVGTTAMDTAILFPSVSFVVQVFFSFPSLSCFVSNYIIIASALFYCIHCANKHWCIAIAVDNHVDKWAI